MLELMQIGIKGHIEDLPNRFAGAAPLPDGLLYAWNQATEFLKVANENLKNVAAALASQSPDALSQMMERGEAAAFIQAGRNRRQQILDVFDNELEVLDESDRPRIRRLLEELVFSGLRF
jgi:hypothetical protein